jgi:outer membrane protein assembly complex protein YaeT
MAALASFAEPVVRRVEFLPANQPIEANAIAERVSVQPGRPLNRLEVRHSIQRLFASGRYANIRVETEPEGDEAVVRFVTEPAWFVGRVTVNGAPEPPNPGQLITATQLNIGQPFYEDHLPPAVESLKRVLEGDGLYNAEVDYAVTRDAATQQAHVDFQVKVGGRARFSRPEILGAAPGTESGIIRATKWPRFLGRFGWKTVTGQRVNQGLERIRKYYSNQDLLLNRVELSELKHSGASNTVQPVVKVTPGALVDIRIEGVGIGRGRLQNLVPVFQEKTVDRDLLVEGERRITEYLQSEGHFQAKVRFEVREGPHGRQSVVYRVEPGPKFKLSVIEITGNTYFDRTTLAERMNVTPASRVRYRNGRFSETMLRSDLAAIEELYRSNGFRDVEVTSDVKTRFGGKDNFLDVTVHVKEGQQWLIESLDLVGVDGELEEYLRSLTGSQEGQPFSESAVAVDREQILSFFYNRGFPEASFDWRVEPGAQPHRVALRFDVRPGDPLTVRGVLVSGLKTSRPQMVNRRIQIEPGEPLSQARLVESQRRLHDLGMFARVDTALQNPDGDEDSKFVQFQFEEARRWSMNMGVGAEIARIGGGGAGQITAPAGQAGFSPRILLGLSRLNLFGYGHTISLQTRLSNIQQRTLASYLVPHFVGRQNLSLNVTGFNDLTRDVNTFTGRRQEGSGQLTQVVSRAWTLQGRYAYRRNTVTDLVIDPELIPLYSQPVRVGIASSTVILDKRDDPVDSTRGMYHYVDLGLASEKLGGDTSYTRIFGRTSNYHRVGRDMVFAHSFSLGWQYNLKLLSTAGIPLPERFYSGGASTHRGFPINQAGPRDTETGFPLGGSALLMNNFELRFPLVGDNLGAVVFHDAGNVYTSLEKVSFRVIQKDVQDFDYMVHAVGLGFRYRTPIGPIRLDFAYAPNSPRFFGFRGSYDDLINGRGQQVLQRVSRFQFHFSFGQTF